MRAIITKNAIKYNLEKSLVAKVIREITDFKNRPDGYVFEIKTFAQNFKEFETEKANEDTGKTELVKTVVESRNELRDSFETTFFTNDEIIQLEGYLSSKMPKNYNYKQREEMMLVSALIMKAGEKNLWELSADDWEVYVPTEPVITIIEKED